MLVREDVPAETHQLNERAHRLIPAGCLSYSKGDDQFPQNAPQFIDRAEGCYAYDVTGRRFLDWGMGLRTVMLGHAYPPVLAAVQAQLSKGSNFTRPSVLEGDLAERFAALIPCAEMVKFAKNGSDVTSAAIRLARAFTGRDYVACCGDGSFFSHDDWFIGTTACNAGVPRRVQELTLRFPYNDLPALERLVQEHPGQIAAVILEAMTTVPPAAGYLAGVRALTRREGAVLIFDEMITGFRWDLRGAQTYFHVTPDVATFGKALANGFALSAIAGRRDIMEAGGLHHTRERVYLLSSTHGSETHALAAALTTLREIEEQEVVSHIWAVGAALQHGFNHAVHEAGLDGFVAMEGFPCSPLIVCRDRKRNASPPFRTLFLQEMAARGVLIPYLAPSLAHTESEVAATLEASGEALQVYRQALEDGWERHLNGPAVQPVFRRFNHAQ